MLGNIAPSITTSFPNLLTPEEAANFLQVSPSTLSVWRSCKRYALPYYKIGGNLIRYRMTDLIEFIDNGLNNNNDKKEENAHI